MQREHLKGEAVNLLRQRGSAAIAKKGLLSFKGGDLRAPTKRKGKKGVLLIEKKDLLAWRKKTTLSRVPPPFSKRHLLRHHLFRILGKVKRKGDRPIKGRELVISVGEWMSKKVPGSNLKKTGIPHPPHYTRQRSSAVGRGIAGGSIFQLERETSFTGQ